jgi:drug/metabolite transporter (DMT)-like permease
VYLPLSLLGLKSTSASNAGFLVSLTVVFVPLLFSLLLRKLPEKRVIFGVLSALTGIGFLTIKNSFTIHSGDVLCIVGALGSVLGLSILCSAIGFIVQTTAQKYTTPTHTGLLFSLEPVFAALFAYAFADEILTIKGYIGAGLVLLSVCTTQINLKKVVKKQGYRTSNVESERTK